MTRPGEPEEMRALRAENEQLRQERDLAWRQTASMRSDIGSINTSVAQLNERLETTLALLRRREEQLKRAQTQIRKLQRALGLEDDEEDEDDDPEPQPPRIEGPDAPDSASSEAVAQDSPSSASDVPQDRPKSESSPKKPRTGGRRIVPSTVPEESEHHGVDSCGHCASQDLLQRDQLVSRKYNVVQSYVRCRRIVRDVVVCKDCRGRTTAPMPPMPCPRALYTCAFLAWLVVQKFVLLVPIDRIRRLLLSQGVDIPIGTLVALLERASVLADAVDGAHWKSLKSGGWLCTDGTGLKVQLDGQDKAWNGYLEVYVRDELTVFQFDLTKHGDHCAQRLKGFQGVIVCDQESRFSDVFAVAGRQEAGCNAHARRKFRDAEKVQPQLAAQGGRFLTALYSVEDEARKRGLVGAELLALRKRKTARILRRFRVWLDKVHARALLPSDLLGRAVNYYRTHVEALTRFVSDARLPIDNNGSEREFQHHAKLRLNSLFAGSLEGAHRWATLLGVVRTAQKFELDVQAYLTWMFERRGTHRDHFGLSAEQLTPRAYRDLLEQQDVKEAA